MKFKISKTVKIVISVLISIILIAFASYKIYFEKLFIFKEQEKLFLSGVLRYFEINKTFVPKTGDYKTLTLQDMYTEKLVETLYVPKKLKFCDVNSSFIRVINENGTLRYVTYLDCGKFKSKVDHTSPVVVLNGEKKIIVDLYSGYQEPGIKTVVDDKDGVIDNNKVEIISNVNTNKIGNYKVVYKIADRNQNVTKEVRTVVVADNLNNIIKRDTNNENYYKGNVENNYILFSGMLFRLVKINDNNTVKIVSDDNISHLSYTEDNYIESNLRKWLNNYYMDHINENSKKYIADGMWCTDNIDNVNNFTCNNTVKDKVGLINIDEYRKSFDGRSYLDGEKKQALVLNKKNSETLYITGLLYQTVAEGDAKLVFPAVRPAINLKEKVYVISGNGTRENPYMIGDYSQGKENGLLNERLSGEFIKFSGYLMRVIGQDKNGNTEVIMMEELSQKSYKDKMFVHPSDYPNYKFLSDENIGKKLNGDFINYLNYNYLVESSFLIPKTQFDGMYDSFELSEMKGKLYLPYTYQMFSADVSNGNHVGLKYLFSDHTDDGKIFILNSPNQMVFNVLTDTYYEYVIRPVMFINKNARIDYGKGTISEPYYLK